MRTSWQPNSASRERVRQIEVPAFEKVQKAVKNRAAALETELGYPLTRAIQNRRVKRDAHRLRAQWSGYDEVLKQPALRETMSNKYGASDDDKLKRHMLMAALQEKPVLVKWLKNHERTPSVSNVLELVTEVSRLPQSSSCEDGKH